MARDLLARLVERAPAVVHADLPRSGLANMLIVWARAAIFAELNRLPFAHSGWLTPRIGPWIRREQRKRLYMSYVRWTSPLQLAQAVVLGKVGHVLEDPPIAALPSLDGGCVYTFRRLPHHSDYFVGIRGHRDILRRRIVSLLSTRCLRELRAAERPFVGLHIRRGDFPRSTQERPVSHHLAQAPIEFFVDALQGIRRSAAAELPAVVFSDGSDDELAPLLRLPRVERAPRRSDMVDLLALSGSRVIVTSPWSTFSGLAVLLGDGPSIVYPVQGASLSRSDAMRASQYEGTPQGDVWPEDLVQQLRAAPDAGPVWFEELAMDEARARGIA